MEEWTMENRLPAEKGKGWKKAKCEMDCVETWKVF
jgi:hypothetical protein